VQQTPPDYLLSLNSADQTSPSGVKFDGVVLAHCLWYFSSPSLILSTLRELKRHARYLFLAEWSLSASDPAAQPHVLAALAQASLECHKADSESNVRTVLSPKRLTELALNAGWQLRDESRVAGGEGLLDGVWEVGACLSPTFTREIEEQIGGERERGVVLALRDACEASLESVPAGRKGVTVMDVWCASFTC
jgi:hypothetical protein